MWSWTPHASRDLSPREVADVTGLSRSLIYREMERGNLVAYKRGGRIRIEQQALADWKEAARMAPRSREPMYEPVRRPTMSPAQSSFTADLAGVRARTAA